MINFIWNMLNVGYQPHIWFIEEPNGASDAELKFIPREMTVAARAPSGIP